MSPNTPPRLEDLGRSTILPPNRSAAQAEELEREVAATRDRRILVRRRWRIEGRAVAGFVAVLLVPTFASRWHTSLRDVVSCPLSAV